MSKMFTPGLLQELGADDLDWIAAQAQHRQLSAGDALIQPQQPINALYILLSGSFAIAQPPLGIELKPLISGDLIGAIPCLLPYLNATSVVVQTGAQVLAIDRTTIATKLTEDLSFAAHLYRAIARRLAQQLTQLQRQLGQSAGLYPTQRASVTLFAELEDADVDWLIAAGQVQHLGTNTVLTESHRPLDGLWLMLDGGLVLSRPEVESNPIVALFATAADRPEAEFLRLSRGDILGEMVFANADPVGISARALRESQVLFIPRWRLAAKLLHDVGFASRFYRALIVLLTNQQQNLLQQHRDRVGNGGEPSGTESDSQFLTRVALAEARFEWILKRIQTKVVTEKVVLW